MTQNGKAFNEYMHQAAPGAPVEHFSDKPIKVGGVRYHPKWAWSAGYRKHFREGHRDWPTNADSHEVLYRAWLFNDREISFEDAMGLIRRQREGRSRLLN